MSLIFVSKSWMEYFLLSMLFSIDEIESFAAIEKIVSFRTVSSISMALMSTKAGRIDRVSMFFFAALNSEVCFFFWAVLIELVIKIRSRVE